MPYIMLGEGAVSAVIKVKDVPEVGDILRINKEMLIAGTPLSPILIGKAFQLTSKGRDFKTSEYGYLTHFSIRSVEIQLLG